MPYEAQRASHARMLSNDAKSDELVHLDYVIPPVKRIQVIDDGVEFIPIPGPGSYPTTPRVIRAAVPSMLAERLAEVAVRAKAGDSHVSNEIIEDQVRNWLRRNFWDRRSVLFDILPKEEDDIRYQTAMDMWIPHVFSKIPNTMPRVYKTWAPENTLVSPATDGTAVIFKDAQQKCLLRFWLTTDEGPNNKEPIASVIVEQSDQTKQSEPQRRQQSGSDGDTHLSAKVSRSPYTGQVSSRTQLRSVDVCPYDMTDVLAVAGGLLIGKPSEPRLKVAIPSDLAQCLKAVAIQAAKPSPIHQPDRTATERVSDVVREWMETWSKNVRPAMADLASPQENAEALPRSSSHHARDQHEARNHGDFHTRGRSDHEGDRDGFVIRGTTSETLRDIKEMAGTHKPSPGVLLGMSPERHLEAKGLLEYRGKVLLTTAIIIPKKRKYPVVDFREAGRPSTDITECMAD
ncbi:hypothetical protein E8E14_009094 [Neopestalotiopsis sp. 37M]|nr:hypothetical protein E8E14_009094 [Neopestalotiopsis sp. 37M]